MITGALLNRSWSSTAVTTFAAGSLAAVITTRYFTQSVRADSPSSTRKMFGGGPALLSLPLETGEKLNHNTRLLRFKFDDPEAVSGLSANASVLVGCWPKGSFLPVVRPYTPVGLDEKGHLDLIVKQYPNGKMSTHLHGLQPGQSLFFLSSLKGYQWKPNAHKHIALIAGGAGITPIYQLAQAILRNPEDKTALTVVFGVNSDSDVLLKKEFADWEKQFPDRFKAIYTVSRPVEGSPHLKGYVTKELLQKVVSNKKETMVFVCGPPSMEQALVGGWRRQGILQDLGFSKDQIHKF